MIINSLDELTPEAILDATIFDDQFISEEWGGCNQLFMLDDGNVGIYLILLDLMRQEIDIIIHQHFV